MTRGLYLDSQVVSAPAVVAVGLETCPETISPVASVSGDGFGVAATISGGGFTTATPTNNTPPPVAVEPGVGVLSCSSRRHGVIRERG